MRNKYVVINESRPSSIKVKSKDSFIIKDSPKQDISYDKPDIDVEKPVESIPVITLKENVVVQDIPKESIVVAELNTSSNQCSTYLKTENALSEFVGTTLKEKALDNLGIPKLIQDIVKDIEIIQYGGHILRLEMSDFQELQSENLIKEDNIYIVTINGIMNQLFVGYDLIAKKDKEKLFRIILLRH